MTEILVVESLRQSLRRAFHEITRLNVALSVEQERVKILQDQLAELARQRDDMHQALTFELDQRLRGVECA